MKIHFCHNGRTVKEEESMRPRMSYSHYSGFVVATNLTTFEINEIPTIWAHQIQNPAASNLNPYKSESTHIFWTQNTNTSALKPISTQATISCSLSNLHLHVQHCFVIMCHDMPRQLVGISIAQERENEGMETYHLIWMSWHTDMQAVGWKCLFPGLLPMFNLYHTF